MWGLAAAAFAGEGMWLPEQLPALADPLAEAGIRVPATTLADPAQLPLAAIVSLGGCSASFVSADGLVITNAHCATRLVSNTSDPAHDRVVEGWVAPSRDQELAGGPSARMWVVEGITDVTAAVREVVDDPRIADADRVAAVDQRKSELVARCEKSPGRRCVVVDLYGGRTWQLVRRLELRDVRVVWVPPQDVAFFGGDADNFEWPRHDGDVALLRAYVGPDGRPAEPAPANVPYRPPRWLPIDPTGVEPGEPVLVVGYPGRTLRLVLPEQLTFAHDVANPAALAWLAEIEAILADEMARDPAARSKLQATARGIANGRKRVQGLQDALDTSTVLDERIAFGHQVVEGLGAEQRAAVDALRQSLAAQNARFAMDRPVDALLRTPLLQSAWVAYRWSIEREVRVDAKREPGFQDRDRADRVAAMRQIDSRWWAPYERRYVATQLRSYAALPTDQHVPALDRWLDAHGGLDGAVDALFAAPALTDADARVALLSEPRARLEASVDPWVSLAVTLERDSLAARRRTERAAAGLRLRLEPVWVDAVVAARGGLVAPDANGTLRVTFGRVVGYAPRDGLIATPQTRLQGLIAKDRAPGYHAPPALIEAASRVTVGDRWVDPALGDVPVNFLADLDTTGGNSGSATLNADGQLVGLAFDGNYEAMGSDWQYDPVTTRSLHVDVRYVGWLLEHEPAAGWIRAELGL